MHCLNRLLIIIALFFPSVLPAQDITGLWKGTMHNDTTGKDLRYEIAISEKKGKLYGYSHTFFILDDREYYGLKKVKIRKTDDKIIIEDAELITHNYPIPPAKGVHQLNILTLEIQDSIMRLTGPFTTNRTKEYASLTGNINLKRKNDYYQSALVPHLEELGLSGELSFVQPEKLIASRSIVKAEPVLVKATPVKKEKKIREPELVITKPGPVITKSEPVITKPEPIKIETPVNIQPAADVAKRKIETIQSVFFKSDSLVLTLYDNGEVDGDTVSVLMNGKVIMPMEGLSTRAIRKTIYITPDLPDSIQLIMYAENLGSIPPNTGLLVVHDGEDVYEIRFSGDLEKNAAIVFRRKKK
jgi:hypothetical protein